MSPRPDVSEERKNQIINAAIAVFSRLGIHKARMDDIVDESQLSKGTLYNYFKSKDDIILAILGSLFEREFADLQKMLDEDNGSVRQRIEKMINYTMADIQRMVKLLPLTFEFYALAFRQKTIRQGLKDYFHKYNQLIIPVIQQGIEQGEFKPVTPQDVAIGLGALVEGTALLWVYDPEMVDIDHHGPAAVKIFLDGLQTRAD